MWPSAVVLSSWLLANPEILYNKQILELGAGCGLTGLVASRIVSEYEQQQQQQKQMQLDKKVSMTEEEKKCDGNGGLTIKNDQDMNMKEGKKVKMTDFNSKVLTNLDRNIDLNQLNHVATTSKLDFYCQKGNNYPGGWITEQKSEFEIECGGEQPPVDLILAADVICKPSDSIAASKTIYDVLKPGGEAIIVSADAKHRFGVDIFERECKSVGLELKVINVTDLCDGKLLPQTESSDDPCGIRQTSGFVDGMSLTMFRIIKPEK
jgi:predicted nicotinamide N-methyase